MDNEQLNSNLNELIKNQIEICEKLDKLGKRIKKIGKAKKESNYDLNNIFGNPVEQFDKIKFKKTEPDYICIVDLPEFSIKRGDVFRYSCRDNYVTIINNNELRFSKEFFIEYRDNFDNYEVKHATPLTDLPNQDQKYYLCIKDYIHLVKKGTVLKRFHDDRFIKDNDIEYSLYLRFIDTQTDHFIPIQQFETLKEGQEIEFTLRNGKTYKTLVKKDSCDKYTLSLWHQLGNCPYQELNQIEFKTNLLKEYGNSWWLTTNNLEDLTKELNKLITLPDLSKESKHIKTDQNESLLVQANELIDKFMPLVNGWDKNQPKHNECYQGAINEPVIGLWYYSQQNQRKAAIKCAIVHCELWIEVAFGHAADEPLLIKSQLQKMLSE